MTARGSSSTTTPLFDHDQWLNDVMELISEVLDDFAARAAQQETTLPTAVEVASRVADLVLPAKDDNPMVELLAPFWSSSKLQTEFGTIRQALDSRMKVGSLLGLKTGDGQLVFPVFQFIRSRRGALTVRPGVIEMLKVARDSTDYEPWTFATLLLTPASELDDRTPIAWMRDQDQDQGELRKLAHRWVHEWSQ